MAALVFPPCLVAHVRAGYDSGEQDDLDEEPEPAAGFLAGVHVAAALALGGAVLAGGGLVQGAVGAGGGVVEVLGLDADDVVVVAQLAGLGAEAEVGDGGDGRGLVGLEAQLPLVLGLVLELELEALVLPVREARFGGDGIGADPARRAAHELALLAVVGLVVHLLAVADDCHDVGEDGSGAVVLVGIDEDAEALELVYGAKDRTGHCSLLGEPHGKAVSVQVTFAVELEFDFDLEGGVS